MYFLRLYARVFTLLGPEKRLGVVLALAHVALAGAPFAGPAFFGRVIDALVGAQTAHQTPSFHELLPLLAAWGGFGLFSIASGVFLALHSDRLSHRRRLGVITKYFESVLPLP